MNAVNLIPADQRRGAAGSLGVYAVLGVLTLVLVAVTALVLTSNEISSRKQELAGVTARRQALTTQVSALAPYVSFTTLEQTRLDTVRTLAASRFAWDRAMRGLSRVTTSQVWLTTMLGTVAPGVTVDSGASSGSSSGSSSGGGGDLRSDLPNPAIELTGCGVSNGAVVAYTSRLRTLHGVVRVSLSDSEKPDESSASASATAAATAAAAATGATQGCGSGANTVTFHAVVFFSPLPVATATPAAATTGTATTAAQPATSTTAATP